MTEDRSVFDVTFEDQSLGLTFVPSQEDMGARVDGFYQLNGKVLQAEESMKVALFDRVVAVQGKSVEGYDFGRILKQLHTKKRPIRITFERTNNSKNAEITWNEVLSNTRETYIYLSFLRRKCVYLCSLWLAFLLEMERLNFCRGEERTAAVKKMIADYILEGGAHTRYMFYVSPLPVSKLAEPKDLEYCLHNLKVQLRDRIRKLTWDGFVASPEYQFIRLNMKTVLYDRHTANLFLAFLISRSSYRELALWMDIHYKLMPLLKRSHYPENVEDAYDYCLVNLLLPNYEDDTEKEQRERDLATILEKCSVFAEAESVLKTKAMSYLSPDPYDALSRSVVGTDALNRSVVSVDAGEMEDELQRRLSESSMASVEERDGDDDHVAYSDEEMKCLTGTLDCLFKQYWEKRSFSLFPSLYYDVISQITRSVNTGTYLDSSTLDLLINLLACMQIRLFQFLLNDSYPAFVVTDLFEYLVSEIRFPKGSTLSFARLKKATQYVVDRLQSCEEEVPHLRKFIQGGV